MNTLPFAGCHQSRRSPFQRITKSGHKKSTLPFGGRAFSYVFLSSSLDEFLTAANINLSLLWRRDNATAEVVDDVVRNALRVGVSRDRLYVRQDVRRFDIPE